MKKDIFSELEELPTAQERLDCIAEYYSHGEQVLDGVDPDELADLLDVDSTGFSGDWEFEGVPDHEPDANSISRGMAEDIVSLLRRSEADPERLAELEKTAELIDGEDDADGTIIERLGLTPDEIVKAVNGSRSQILEGDAGWSHLATLRMTARNGLAIEFQVTYDDCDREASFTVHRSIENSDEIESVGTKAGTSFPPPDAFPPSQLPEISTGKKFGSKGESEPTMTDLQRLLVDDLLKNEESILDSLQLALKAARKAGGTAGHKHGSRLNAFRRIVDLAKTIREGS